MERRGTGLGLVNDTFPVSWCPTAGPEAAGVRAMEMVGGEACTLGAAWSW